MAAAVAFFGATHDAINQLAPCFQPFQGDALSEGPGRKGTALPGIILVPVSHSARASAFVPGRRPDTDDFFQGLAQSALRAGLANSKRLL
jgi:hypothetical protein